MYGFCGIVMFIIEEMRSSVSNSLGNLEKNIPFVHMSIQGLCSRCIFFISEPKLVRLFLRISTIYNVELFKTVPSSSPMKYRKERSKTRL